MKNSKTDQTVTFAVTLFGTHWSCFGTLGVAWHVSTCAHAL